jgi:predicted nucleic acid-binding protein
MEIWLERVTQTYNVIPVETRIFRCWAQLMHRQPGHLAEDAMIAATAELNNLTVVTRNVRDFERFKVKVFNPFSYVRRP